MSIKWCQDVSCTCDSTLLSSLTSCSISSCTSEKVDWSAILRSIFQLLVKILHGFSPSSDQTSLRKPCWSIRMCSYPSTILQLFVRTRNKPLGGRIVGVWWGGEAEFRHSIIKIRREDVIFLLSLERLHLSLANIDIVFPLITERRKVKRVVREEAE